MKCNKTSLKLILHPVVFLGMMLFALSGCGGSGGGGDTGYIKFYNASTNAPGIFLTVDEKLDSDDSDDVEVTYSSVAYGSVSATNSLDKGKYYVELGYQVDDSTDRDDLEMIYQERHQIRKDHIDFIVLTGDINSPAIHMYDIKVVDDDDDDDDELFNVRLLNLSTKAEYSSLDLYMSKDNETFNEAKLVGTMNAEDLSDNIKLDQDKYIYYITVAGSSEVLYTSEDVNYPSVNQYVIAIRENQGVGGSPFTIDSIGTNGVTNLDDVDSESQFTFYNAVEEDLVDGTLPNYQNELNIDVKRNGNIDFVFDNLKNGEFTNTITTSHGDYVFNVIEPTTSETYLSNALLTLEKNADNTVFVYGQKTPIDDDEDGIIDENEDGIVDGYETKIKSLVVANSTSGSIYSHSIKIVNLSDSDDFSRAKFYFVQNDETIDTATYSASVLEEKTGSVTLINNTYDVYVIAVIDDNDVILDVYNLQLNEESKDQFLIFKANPAALSGFQMKFINQLSDD